MNLPNNAPRPIPPQVLDLLGKVKAAYDQAQRRHHLPELLLRIKLNEAEWTAKNMPERAVPVLEDALAIFTAYAEASDAELQRMKQNQTIYPGSDPRNPARLLFAQEQAAGLAGAAAAASRQKYSAAELIAQLANRGIRLSAKRDGKLLADAPKGAITDADRELLRTHKVGLIEALNARVEEF